MSTVALIAANVRHAIELLAELDEQAALDVARALTAWLGGTDDFAQALGLPADWRWRLRIAARDRALGELSRLRADLDAKGLAELIRADRHSGPRRDGWRGYVDDYRRAGFDLSQRHLRRLIGEIRGQGQSCIGHDGPAPSTQRQARG